MIIETSNSWHRFLPESLSMLLNRETALFNEHSAYIGCLAICNDILAIT